MTFAILVWLFQYILPLIIEPEGVQSFCLSPECLTLKQVQCRDSNLSTFREGETAGRGQALFTGDNARKLGGQDGAVSRTITEY